MYALEMASTPLESLNYPEAELVFGLVAAVGTDLERFQNGLIAQLKYYNYQGAPIRLSQFLGSELDIKDQLDFSSEYARIDSHMTAGTKVRKLFNRGDVLALYAASKIASSRTEQKPRAKTAHILNSLKHPDELTALRRIYGSGFFLVGVYAPEDERVAYLVQRKGMSRDQALKLVQRDQDEGEPFGQKTRETFHRADVFVHFRSEENANKELERFLDLAFGDPFQTPTASEHTMFLAFANALRSADLSRQVGAVVASASGEIIAVGANDVPRFGGGLYWPGDDDRRDFIVGVDSNEDIRNMILRQIASKFPGCEGLSEDALTAKGAELFGDSIVVDITEFGRPVHAEMDALLTCARVGVSPKGGTLYCTTFPCHNCAKHIVHAGLSKVIYVEPYPKSRAQELYPDSIAVDTPESGKVLFEPFVGIGPRRYFDLFSMKLGSGYDTKRKASGKKAEWNRGEHRGPRIAMAPNSYLEREQLAVAEIAKTEKKNDIEKK
jgi:deoxycytidylate deaminase